MLINTSPKQIHKAEELSYRKAACYTSTLAKTCIESSSCEILKKKYTYGDCVNSITPWHEEQQGKTQKNKVLKPNNCYAQDLNKIKAKIDTGLSEKSTKQQIPQSSLKKRKIGYKNKTEFLKEGSGNDKVKLSTIDILQHMKSLKSNKQSTSQDKKTPRVSIHRFRENLLQSGGLKGSVHSRTISIAPYHSPQSKKKPRPKFPTPKSTKSVLARSHNKSQSQHVCKTECAFEVYEQLLRTKMNSQKDGCTLFLFKAKNSSNMMNRQKNIIKIRNLGQRTRRAHTEAQNQ